MSKITVIIDRIVLKGFEPADRKALVAGLHGELSRVLTDPATGLQRARSHRTPVMKFGGLTMGPGVAKARKFGGGIARAIGSRLKA